MTRPPVSGEPTFNPAVPNDPEPGQVCEDCGKPRYQHRDGGAAYGLICPPVSGEPRPWPRGRCEFWQFWRDGRAMCGERGRWMVNGSIRCSKHKEGESA